MVRKVKGSWWVDFQIRLRRHRYRSPENTREGALAYEASLRQKLGRGEDISSYIGTYDKTSTFKAFSSEWFETMVKTENKLSEVRTKASTLRIHLVPFFGDVLLKEITSQQVERYKMLKVRAGLSAKSVNNHLVIFQRCLNVAQEWGRLDRVPKIGKLKTVSQRLDFLSPVESRKLVQASADEPVWRDMLLMALRTGMRLGELCGLQWRDVDFQRKILTVQRSLVRGVLGTPKNNRVRHIPLTKDLWRSIYERRDQHTFVFHQPNGNPLSDGMGENAMRRACKKAGIRYIGWHTLRHTFASQLVSEGVPLNAVQELLGHSSIVMTMKYAHLAQSALRSAVDVLEKAENREVLAAEEKCQPGVNREQLLPEVVIRPTTHVFESPISIDITKHPV